MEVFPGITIRGTTIDFGDQARFDTDSAVLTGSQARHLRAFVPRVLAIARDPLGQRWLKRVVVEGYADQRAHTSTTRPEHDALERVPSPR